MPSASGPPSSTRPPTGAPIASSVTVAATSSAATSCISPGDSRTRSPSAPTIDTATWGGPRDRAPGVGRVSYLQPRRRLEQHKAPMTFGRSREHLGHQDEIELARKGSPVRVRQTPLGNRAAARFPPSGTARLTPSVCGADRGPTGATGGTRTLGVDPGATPVTRAPRRRRLSTTPDRQTVTSNGGPVIAHHLSIRAATPQDRDALS